MKKQRKENVFKTQFEGMSQSEIDFFKKANRKKSKKEKKEANPRPRGKKEQKLRLKEKKEQRTNEIIENIAKKTTIYVPKREKSIESFERQENLREKVLQHESLHFVLNQAEKKDREFRKEERKDKILKTQQLNAKIKEKKEKRKQLLEEFENPKNLYASNRKISRAEAFGKINGRKNRKKNRIKTLLTEPKRILKGQYTKFSYAKEIEMPKNRYVENPNAQIKEIVVLTETLGNEKAKRRKAKANTNNTKGKRLSSLRKKRRSLSANTQMQSKRDVRRKNNRVSHTNNVPVLQRKKHRAMPRVFRKLRKA